MLSGSTGFSNRSCYGVADIFKMNVTHDFSYPVAKSWGERVLFKKIRLANREEKVFISLSVKFPTLKFLLERLNFS